MLQKLISAVLCSAVAVVAGCGGGSDTPQLGEVSGTITMDGKPLAKAVVTFSPKDGRPATGVTDSEGKYTLTYLGEAGTKVGKNVVSITTQPPESEDGGCAEPEETGFIEPIPLRYNREAIDNPDMNVEVKPGGNTFDFKLTSEGPKATGTGCGGSTIETCQ